MDKNFINENSFSRLIKRMKQNYSSEKYKNNDLKDVVTISANRNYLVNIHDNDKILNMFYDKETDTYDIDGIIKHLKKENKVLVDKELTIDKNKKLIKSKYPYTKQENKKRNKDLCQKLKDLHYGVTKIEGSFLENGLPEDAETSENSFFVVNLENNLNFLNDIAYLSEYYNQDCFMIKIDVDEDAFLVGTNGNNNPDYPAYHEFKNIGKLKINREIKGGEDGKNYSKLRKDKFAFQNENKYNKYIKESIMDTGKLDKYDLEEFGVYEEQEDFPYLLQWSWEGAPKNAILNGISYETLEEEFDNDVDLWLEYNKKSNNKGCWNCIDCENCISCDECIECITCEDCHGCSKCEKCLDCYGCDRCKHCCNLDIDMKQDHLGMKYEDDMEDDDGSGEWLYYFDFDKERRYDESRKTTGKLLKESKDVNYEIVLDALEDYFTTNKNFYTDNRSYTSSDLINKYGISKSLDKVEGWEDVENLSVEYGLNKNDKESVKSIVNNYEKKLKKQVLKSL